MKNVKMKVNGIHCNGCANKIKNSINSLNVENKTEVEVDTGNVHISFDSNKASVADLKSKITDVGFQIESIEIE
jgi:copper chaperone CopZ